jgi:hypothetical protein
MKHLPLFSKQMRSGEQLLASDCRNKIPDLKLSFPNRETYRKVQSEMDFKDKPGDFIHVAMEGVSTGFLNEYQFESPRAPIGIWLTGTSFSYLQKEKLDRIKVISIEQTSACCKGNMALELFRPDLSDRAPSFAYDEIASREIPSSISPLHTLDNNKEESKKLLKEIYKLLLLAKEIKEMNNKKPTLYISTASYIPYRVGPLSQTFYFNRQGMCENKDRKELDWKERFSLGQVYAERVLEAIIKAHSELVYSRRVRDVLDF